WDAAGRVHVEAVGDDLWIGGDCGTCITGEIVL
ncbi:phenazine biosynthesis protein PhzF, partial [Xanthomonas sp. Kuri4-3]